MITIITGKKNSGKSTYLKQWYLEEKNGCGIISEKIFLADSHIGYNILLLPDEIKLPLCRLPQYTEDLSGAELIQQGRYLFSSEVFKSVSDTLKEELPAHSVLWLDEVGYLELFGYGYADIIDDAQKKQIELRLSVRETLLDKILHKFRLNDCRIITL